MFVQLPWHPQSDSSMNPECPVRILCGGRSRHDSYVRHTYKTVMECRRKYFAAWRQKKKNEWTRFIENGREKKTYPSKASFKYNKAPSITPQQIQLSSNNSIQLQSSQVYVNVMILTDSHGHSRSALLNVPSIRTTDRVSFFFLFAHRSLSIGNKVSERKKIEEEGTQSFQLTDSIILEGSMPRIASISILRLIGIVYFKCHLLCIYSNSSNHRMQIRVTNE